MADMIVVRDWDSAWWIMADFRDAYVYWDRCIDYCDEWRAFRNGRSPIPVQPVPMTLPWRRRDQ